MLDVRSAARGLRGQIQPPGDKSLSHRALIFGALAHGDTRISGLLESADVHATAGALRQLGVTIRDEEGSTVVEGRGGRDFVVPKAELDMGNSGTAMRLLAGVLAARPLEVTLVGDASLSQRPMRRIMEPLRRMGADIRGAPDDTAPLQIRGGRLAGIDYASPVASAQVKSCILLAGLSAEGRTRVRELAPSRDHTERLLAHFGAPLDTEGWVTGGRPLASAPVGIPADPSSAAFALAAALLVPGSDILLRNVGLNPTRTGFLEVVRAMGADIEIRETAVASCEPAGDIRVRYGGRLAAAHVTASQVPALVDEIPILMALAGMSDGVTRIRGAAELRVKESDRLAVMGAALEKLGVGVVMYEDGADIEGVPKLQEVAELDGAGDHRCVMSLGILALCSRSGLRIRGAEYIDTSYPGFATDLGLLGADVRLEAAA